MKKILVTTDLSKESAAAFRIAKQLAQKFDSSLQVLMVVEDPGQAAMSYGADPMVFPFPAILQDVVKRVQADLKKFAQSELEDLPHEEHVLDTIGGVSHEIVEFAKKSGVDLIVMASHGRTGIKRLLIGSVTEKVVRYAPCAVLVVPVGGK